MLLLQFFSLQDRRPGGRSESMCFPNEVLFTCSINPKSWQSVRLPGRGVSGLGVCALSPQRVSVPKCLGGEVPSPQGMQILL